MHVPRSPNMASSHIRAEKPISTCPHLDKNTIGNCPQLLYRIRLRIHFYFGYPIVSVMVTELLNIPDLHLTRYRLYCFLSSYRKDLCLPHKGCKEANICTLSIYIDIMP